MNKCPRCCCEATGQNRLVTDSCGHTKCRLCLVADVSDCLECRVANQETGATKPDAKPRTPADKCIVVTDHGYRCTVCNKDFRSRTQQYYHLACGNDLLKKFSCNECSRRFASRSHLQYHLSSHDNQSKHSCSVCHKRFKQQAVLKRHMRTHSAELHACPHCHKEFRGENSLKSHLAAHSDIGLPYKCEICSKQFQSKANLKQHCRKHDNNSVRHKCKVCQKSFLRQSTLRLHMKRHSNRERLACSLCGKSYNDADALARHRKQHMTGGGQRYRCVQCEITVNRKDNMLRHLRSMHPGVAFESCVEIVPPNASDHEPAAVAEERPVESLRYNGVIKSVGNVEPVMLPQSASPEVPLEKPPANPVLMPPLPDAMPEKNVQLYRKIILDLDNEEYSNELSLDDGVEATAAAQSTQDLGLHQSQPRCPGHGSSKFSEMHWRKNFKASYEKGRTN